MVRLAEPAPARAGADLHRQAGALVHLASFRQPGRRDPPFIGGPCSSSSYPMWASRSASLSDDRAGANAPCGKRPPPSVTQAFLLVGTLVLLPVILMYTGWSSWVFRGKVRADIGYH